MNLNTNEQHCIRFENIDLLIPPTEKRNYRKLLHAFVDWIRCCRVVETLDSDYYSFRFKLPIESFALREDDECYLYLLIMRIAGQQSCFDIDIDDIDSVECLSDKQGKLGFLLQMNNGMELIFE